MIPSEHAAFTLRTHAMVDADQIDASGSCWSGQASRRNACAWTSA
jgi:hypothetical protein